MSCASIVLNAGLLYPLVKPVNSLISSIFFSSYQYTRTHAHAHRYMSFFPVCIANNTTAREEGAETIFSVNDG